MLSAGGRSTRTVRSRLLLCSVARDCWSRVSPSADIGDFVPSEDYPRVQRGHLDEGEEEGGRKRAHLDDAQVEEGGPLVEGEVTVLPGGTSDTLGTLDIEVTLGRYWHVWLLL